MARTVLETGWMKRQVDIIKEESDKWPDWRKREAEQRFIHGGYDVGSKEGSYTATTRVYIDNQHVSTTYMIGNIPLNQPKSLATLTAEWAEANAEMVKQQAIVDDLKSQWSRADCALSNIKNREDSLWIALQKAREGK